MTTQQERVLVPGGRWIHQVRNQYSGEAAMSDRDIKPEGYRVGLAADFPGATARRIVTVLDDPETRRMIVDARQASLFVDTHGLPPVGTKYHLPFDQMYIEFTEPLRFAGTHEPGFEEDECVAVIVVAEPLTKLMTLGMSGEEETDVNVVGVTFIKHNPVRSQWVDQGFFFDLTAGRGLTTIHSARGSIEPSVFPDGTVLDSNDRHLFAVREGGDGVGWWERVVHGQSTFFAWLITYMTAKGIIIVEEGQSRQVRRALERMKPKDRPTPWHIVTVDPLLIREQHEEDAEHGERHHSYRYDVRGHLRFGRHKRGDGTYSHTVEWIAPHQRGLANAVYVPKTYVFQRKAGGQ